MPESIQDHKHSVDVGMMDRWTVSQVQMSPRTAGAARSDALIPTETKHGNKAENIQRYFLTAENWSETVNGIIHSMSHSITKKLREK